MNFKRNKILSLYLALVLVLGVVFGAAPMVAFAESEAPTLTIYHVNDVHGRVQASDSAIGYAKLKTIVDKARAENPNVLLLNAGDTLHGNLLATFTKGEAIVELMNKMGFDAMTPGNHEFNYGYDRLMELAGLADFSFLGANIFKEDGTSDFEPYIIKEFDGFKVGIFGISTRETKTKSHPNNTIGIEFENEIEAAKKMVAELEDKVDIIVGLVHVGIDDESDITTIDIAKNVDGIDILVDGHSHHELAEGKLVNDTLIVQTGEWTKNIGLVEVVIKDGEIVTKTAELISLEDTIDVEEDAEIAADIEKMAEDNEEVLQEIIGATALPLDGEREVVRTGESNLGNLITDVMLEKSGADIALTNGGGIRAPIAAGEISLGDVFTTFPFENYLVVIEVTGQTIVDALNHGVDAYPEAAGHFPHVGGMSYKIDTSGEANEVFDVRVAGDPIDLAAKYKLVTNDFVAAGGDDYIMFADATILVEYEMLSEILAEYIRAEGEIAPAVEGRITEGKKPVEEPDPVEEELRKYVVKPGDVLWRIGKMYEKTYQELADFNKIANPHKIFPGQVIVVPN